MIFRTTIVLRGMSDANSRPISKVFITKNFLSKYYVNVNPIKTKTDYTHIVISMLSRILLFLLRCTAAMTRVAADHRNGGNVFHAMIHIHY